MNPDFSLFLKILLFQCLVGFSLDIGATVKNHRRNISENFNLGKQAFNNGDYVNALRCFDKDIRSHRNNASAHMMASMIRYSYGDYGKAMEDVESAIKHMCRKDKKNLSLCYMVRADIYNEMKMFEKAMQDYGHAICIDPGNAGHYGTRAGFYYERGLYDLSDSDYMKIRELEPENKLSYIGIGRNHAARKNFRDAIRQYDMAERLFPDCSSVYSLRAEAYAESGNMQNFSDDIITSIGIDEDSHAVSLLSSYADKAYPYLVAGLKKKALSEPGNDCWPYYLGVLNEKSRKYTHAITSYLDSLKINPDSMTANRISICYSKTGKLKKAAEYIGKAIELDCCYVNNYLIKANIDNDTGKIGDAISDMDYYISKRPDDSWAYYKRGRFKDFKGDFSNAIADYTTAIALDDGCLRAYLGRGDLYRITGRHDKAKSDFEHILKIDTVVANNSFRQYALFYFGKKEEAMAWMQRMLDQDGPANYYCAACFNAIAGESEVAVEYLRNAVKEDYFALKRAINERHLDRIRHLESYKALISEYTLLNGE
ncbi:MAG: tetratricopeptide repeat protein [Bacteroidales bacterium]|jgi:tetratricopeptide (TPR) repeat protein|nr:tetratricopeptide repeat protein [Bacteroidales bacterium]MCI1786210.1 tetratricopeptide repeat protein [Bacteroidales bacterium]